MSGQPYNTPLDISKAREAYLANLKLRAELDDLNLQANKVYTKTGQLPSVPPDTRTTSEKLLDIERLKIEIRGKLLEITDGIEAGKIVDALSPDQLTFLIQNFPPIKDQMKRSYSIGVLAPIFIDFLNRYIDKFNQTQGVEFGLQQSSAENLLANQKIMMNQMPSKEDIGKIEYLVNSLGQRNLAVSRLVKANLDQVQQAISEIPSTFAEINRTDNAILKDQLLQTLNNIVDELPTKRDITDYLLMLERAIKAKDQQNIDLVLQKLNEISTAGVSIVEEMGILKKMIQSNQPIDGKGDEFEQPPSGYEPLTLPILPIAPATAVVGNFPEPPLPEGRKIAEKYKSLDSARGQVSELKTIPQRKQYFEDMFKYIEDSVGLSMSGFAKQIVGKTPSQIQNLKDWEKIIEELNRRLRMKMYGQDTAENLEYYGRGMKGRGIATRVRPSQVLDFDVDYSQGIKPAAKFVPIGRYLINKRQLDRDIIAIKRPAGSTIASLPSQRVSRNLGGVLRKIIGGGLPTFDELDSLDDEEKVYLHKVARETRIDGKLSIPTPKKDEDEKDINQFEILKGQILAGNDNPELVKKFKTILLKLSRKELIPKIQVKELLLDLATLGH